MKNKPILIVAGEPNSIFLELFFKVIKKKIKSPYHFNCIKKITFKSS
jgi:4-hydroxythreonine-4-phosphate dehydrogenase